MAEVVDRLQVRCLGVDLVIHSTDAAVGAEVRRAWRDAEVASVSPSALSVTVGLEGGEEASGPDVTGALHHLSPVVTRRAIEARVGELLMLHAAALADPLTGATAVLIAPSGTGKTTAARTLGKRLAYLSDETAGIDQNGRVLPYRKPLSIIESGWVKTQVAPSSLGLLHTDRECHVSAVLILKRSLDHGESPIVAQLQTVDAIAAIAPEASYLASTPRPLQRIAEIISMAGGAYLATYGEAETLEPILIELLAGGR